jgi:bifunctional non-homologous end joining protein LigD
MNVGHRAPLIIPDICFCLGRLHRRRFPLEFRKATLASVPAKAGPGIRFNEHIEGDGPTIFAHARKLGLEGIVSKRKDSAYRSGRSPDWLKMKNPDAQAVKREAEEDWGR